MTEATMDAMDDSQFDRNGTPVKLQWTSRDVKPLMKELYGSRYFLVEQPT